LKKALLAGALCALVSVACGRGGPIVQNADAGPAQASLPQQILGLRVQPENVASQLKDIKRPYVDAVAVYSLRDGDLLKASLQISRFNGAARPKDPDFIGSIISTIGGSASQAYRVGDQTVYATTGSDQVIFTWFKGDGMFVLAIQKNFPFPRTLLRRLVSRDISV
jgi:hypothetical protein